MSLHTVGTTTTSFDQWVTSITDPGGHRKDLERDAYDRLVRVKEYATPNVFTTTYGWNALGNLTQITDALGNIRRFTYDDVGHRLSAEDLHAPADATFGTYLFEYDVVGNLISRTTPNGAVVTFSYDALNRVLTEDLVGTPEVEANYTYDGLPHRIGRRRTATNGAATVSYDYDFAGNIGSETKTIEGTSYETTYTRDFGGNEVSITNPDNSAVLYVRNIAGLVESVSYREMPTGAPVPIVTNIDYAPTGVETFEECGNGTRTVSLYDDTELYRLRVRRLELNGSPVHTAMYAYDAVGNVVSITETDSTGTTAKTYAYDALSRLSSADVVGTVPANTYTEAFSYSAIGNMLSGPAGPYVYQGSQGSSFANPHAATSIGGAAITYDKNGNVLSDGTRLNSWDYQNRLIETKSP